MLFCAGGSAQASSVRQKNWDGSYSVYKNGNLMVNTWVSVGDNRYYAGSDGKLYTSGVYQVGNYYYGFNHTGARQYGRKRLKGKIYFFSKKTGRMRRSCWIKTKDQYFYYGADGVMVTNQWVGQYYVGSTGTRVTKAWQDNCYLGSDGKAYTGYHKVGSYYYYFSKKNYRKVTNCTLTINGRTYQFDASGHATEANSAVGAIPQTSVSVESTYHTDPYATDEELLAAIIYMEAGNQSYEGQVAVGIVVMNRVKSSLFPSTVREVIYQKSQFEPTRNGRMTQALKSNTIVTASCKKAAKAVLKKFENYTQGQKITLKVNGKTRDFSSYLFFMTPAAYQRLGLRASKFTIGGHVFFKVWK
jgi:glucan-binding YG repeat protein